MAIRISKKDVVWSYAGYFFSLVTNILILPFVIKLVESRELGLWYTFLSIGQVANIFDGTFTGCISRSFTYAWSGVQELKAEGYDNAGGQIGKVNYRLLVSLLKTSRFIFMAVSGAALFFLISLGTVYIGYTARELSDMRWVVSWVIYTLAVFLNLFYSYWLTALRGVGALQQAQKASVLSKIVQIVFSLIGLYSGYGILALAVAYLLSGLILRIYGKYSFLKYEEIGAYSKKYEKEIRAEEIKENFKKIWFNARKSGIVCLSTFVITQTTTLICSGFLGLEETAAYGLSLQVITALAGVAMIYFNAMKPRLTEYKIAGDGQREAFIRLMSVTVVVYWLFYLLEMLALVLIGMPLIEMWKPNTELPVEMVIFMGVYLFLENNHSLFASVIEMSNRVPYVKAGIVSSIFILTGELFVVLATGFGIYGLMFIQFFVQLCYNNWKWPMVVMKEYQVAPWKIFKTGTAEALREAQSVYKIIMRQENNKVAGK